MFPTKRKHFFVKKLMKNIYIYKNIDKIFTYI